jgi:lipopolysaccharide transport system ATP-binding protein
MKPAIRVENLSKQYRIGKKARPGSHNLTESIVEGASSLWRGLTGRGRGGDGADEFWALKDVSFEVQPGEVVGIIGRNGAGKSTLLKILSRIAEPTSGRAVVRGRMASLLEVGTGFHPELTGRENIYLNGSILGMSRQEIRIKFDEIAAFAEIDQFLDTPVKRYSSGMYVRLAFAVAAFLEPEILVLDEVLSVGDASFQKKCLGKIGKVAAGGRTVLLVSHNMAAVSSLCERSVWLSEGRVQAAGSTKSVITKYVDPDRTSISVRRWANADGPVGQGVRLQYAAVVPIGSDHREAITTRTSLCMEFEFATAMDASELNFSVVLDEIERGCIFNTVSKLFKRTASRVVCDPGKLAERRYLYRPRAAGKRNVRASFRCL